MWMHNKRISSFWTQLSRTRPDPKQKNPRVAKEEIYAGFYGVYLPEKAPSNRNNQDRKFHTDSPFHCPRCNKIFAFHGGTKDHFPGCISKQNNPDAFKWNDHISLQPAQEERPRDPARRNKFEDMKAYSRVRIASKFLGSEEDCQVCVPTETESFSVLSAPVDLSRLLRMSRAISSLV